MVEEIGIVTRDMPNMFVEALTIGDGAVHDQAREIAIPPESRITQIQLEPSQKIYRPGEKARVALKLTGPDGKPFVSSTVVAVYDKAVEYISGGSNVPDIKAFFWNWKRHHQPQTESSLARWFHGLTKQNEIAMEDLGAFSDELADETAPEGIALAATRMPSGRGMMGGMGGGRVHLMDGAASFDKSKMPAAAAPAFMAPGGERDKAEISMAPSAAPPPVQPTVRTNFADTAFWAAALVTGPDGTANVDFPLPDSLTTWKVKSWTLGLGTKVGEAEAEIVTSKDLLVRLQAPRFFIEKDEVVLSANVHNKLKTRQVRPGRARARRQRFATSGR